VRQQLQGTANLRRFDDIATKPVPDAAGDAVETNGSQVSMLRLLEDKSPAGIPLYYCTDPYEDSSCPELVLPYYTEGVVASNKPNPIRAMARFERHGYAPEAILQHEACAYKVDTRWRKESPYDTGVLGALAFVGETDVVQVPFDSSYLAGQSSTTYFACRGWFKFGDTTAKRTLFCMSDWSNSQNINFLVYVEGGRLKALFMDGGNGRLYQTDRAPIKKGAWHYLEFCTVPGFKLFIDGVEEATSFTNLGSGGVSLPATSDDLLIGDVPENLRSDYKPFNGTMTDIEVVSNASSTSAFHTTDYRPPSTRVTASTETRLLLAMTEGEDARLANAGTVGGYATIKSHPFVLVAHNLGKALDGQPPSLENFNEKLYISTGQGAPQVYDGESSRRMGIVPPSYAPEIEYNQTPIWDSDAPQYAGTNDADNAESNGSLRLTGNHYIRIPYTAGRGFNLFGTNKPDETTGDHRDTGMWWFWIKPARLDKKMVLMGKNFGQQSGNYWIELIPNADGTALKVRVAWWDVEKGGIKYFETAPGGGGGEYPIDDTSKWWFIFVVISFGAAAGSREDQIRLIGESGSTGSGLHIYNTPGTTLTTSGDLDDTDRPDDSPGDILIGYSDICLLDKTYHPFEGLIAEVRAANDDNRDTTHITNISGPSASHSHIMKAKPNDLTYETAGGALSAASGTTEHQTADWVYNINEGQGTTLEDKFVTSPIDATVETIDALPVQVGLHRFRVTFYDPDTGIESDPGPEASYELRDPKPAEIPSENWFVLRGIPISTDTRKRIYRRIYKTAANGSTFYLAAELKDNEATSVVIDIKDSVLVSQPTMPSSNGFPPFYNVAAATQDRFFIAKNDVRREEGSAGVLYSEAFTPEYIPATNLIPLDSPRGSNVKAIATIFGQVVFFLDEALFVATDTGAGFTVSIVETDAGCLSPRGVVSARRSLFRPAENGIYGFNGTADYLYSKNIQRPLGTWAQLDPDFFGDITGVHWRERGQVIWLVKRASDSRARTRLALDLNVGVSVDQGPHVWTVSDGPELASLLVMRAPDGTTELWGGDHLGFVWRLDSGERDGPRDGFGDVAGAVAAGSSQTKVVTTSSSLDTIQDGHRGEILEVVNDDGEVATARIRSNDASTFYLDEPLPFTPAANARWEVGAVERWFRTGFIPWGPQEEKHLWGHLHLTFEPIVGGVLKVYAWVDFDETTRYDVAQVDMHTGWAQIPLYKEVPRGKFLRLEFRSRQPFVLYDYTVGERRSGPGR